MFAEATPCIHISFLILPPSPLHSTTIFSFASPTRLLTHNIYAPKTPSLKRPQIWNTFVSQYYLFFKSSWYSQILTFLSINSQCTSFYLLSLFSFYLFLPSLLYVASPLLLPTLLVETVLILATQGEFLSYLPQYKCHLFLPFKPRI